MDQKVCGDCHQSKNLSEYNKNKKGKDGLQYRCRICEKQYRKIYYINNKDWLSLKHKEWSTNNRTKHKELQKIWYYENKEHHQETVKKWNENNQQKKLNKQKEWRKKNNHKIQIKNKQRRQNNPLLKLTTNLRNRMWEALGGAVKSDTTIKLLGCSSEEFKIYLERQFTEGMDWSNYGTNGWHVDHIIPLSSGKNQQEIEKLFHYTNCQPLWAKDNWKKSNKY